MSWFTRLREVAAATVSEVSKTVADVATTFSLDVMQDQFGDPTGRKTLYAGLDITYLTPRVIAMGFPSTPDTKIRSRNDAASVSLLLKERHDGHFMVWNLAEESYDYALFDNQVIECRFPGFPSPPLGLLFKICTSIENWLLADPANVAAIHCMTGRGRTAVVSACALAWLGEFDSAITAIDYVCEKRGSTVERMCVPSQLRYAQYFSFVLDGVKPRGGALVLRRVLMNGVPDFSLPLDEEEDEEEAESGRSEGGVKIHDVITSSTAGNATREQDPLGLGAFGKLADKVMAVADSTDAALASALVNATAAVETAASAAAGRAKSVLIAHGVMTSAHPSASSAATSAEEGGSGSGGGATAADAASAPPVDGSSGGVSSSADTITSTTTSAPSASSSQGEGSGGGTSASSAIAAALHVHPPTRSVRVPGCRPYLQLFRSGRLIFSSSWEREPAVPAASSSSSSAAVAAAVAVETGALSSAGDNKTTAADSTAPAADQQHQHAPSLSSAAAAGNAPPDSQIAAADDATQQLQQRSSSSAAPPAAAAAAAASAARRGSLDLSDASKLKWYKPEDASVRFPVDVTLCGDVLARVRHFGEARNRESMFRAAFHTGYAHGHVLRLTRRQLDIACGDIRFTDDFFVEFIFSPVLSASSSLVAASQGLGGGVGIPRSIRDHVPSSSADGDASAAAAAAAIAGEREGASGAHLLQSEHQQTAFVAQQHPDMTMEGTVALSPSDSAEYDAVLDAESSFWGDVAERREQRAARRARAESRNATALRLPLSGPGPTPGEVLAGAGGGMKGAAAEAAVAAAHKAREATAAAAVAAKRSATGTTSAAEAESGGVLLYSDPETFGLLMYSPGRVTTNSSPPPPPPGQSSSSPVPAAGRVNEGGSSSSSVGGATPQSAPGGTSISGGTGSGSSSHSQRRISMPPSSSVGSGDAAATAAVAPSPVAPLSTQQQIQRAGNAPAPGSPEASAAAAPAAVSAGAGSAPFTSELDELEALERELLEGAAAVAPVPSTSAVAAAAAAAAPVLPTASAASAAAGAASVATPGGAPADDADELEKLEKYLSTL